eukprot:scaffold3581_cov252-Pinguiococcus_pyrenoidosus.AAC.3
MDLLEAPSAGMGTCLLLQTVLEEVSASNGVATFLLDFVSRNARRRFGIVDSAKPLNFSRARALCVYGSLCIAPPSGSAPRSQALQASAGPASRRISCVCRLCQRAPRGHAHRSREA